jgi:hypothetical protein
MLLPADIFAGFVAQVGDKVVGAGNTDGTADGRAIGVACYNTDGCPDGSFAGDGIKTLVVKCLNGLNEETNQQVTDKG